MNAVEHMTMWIESSGPHYERLLKLEEFRKREAMGVAYLATVALGIVTDAFREATRGGDMFATEWTGGDLLDCAKALLTWELEQ